MARELLQYDPTYDRKESDASYIGIQLQTHLRERFNVLTSTVEYGIVDGHLVRQGTTEPFIESIRRGRDTVRKLAPTPIDFDREDAEVIGFENRIDPFFGDEKTPLESKILSISLKGDEGSKYQHNFYDIFTLKAKNGIRYVELSRYSSALTAKDYMDRLSKDRTGNPPSAADFLANPIVIPHISITAEQIHQSLHKEHSYMSVEDFDQIWQGVQPAVLNYILNKDANSFNAVLNLADKVWQSQKLKKMGKSFVDYSQYGFSRGELRSLGNEQVRQVSGGCPGKSGASDNSPFSVSEFGFHEPDSLGERTFECPECGKTNLRPKDELLSNCQHCGTDKVAC